MSVFQNLPSHGDDLIVTFATDANNSNVVTLDPTKGQLVGIAWPSAIDGTAATLQMTLDGTTFKDVTALTFAASGYQPLDVNTYRGVGKFRIKFTSNQTANRTVQTICNIVG
jgi:hypothetical protein